MSSIKSYGLVLENGKKINTVESIENTLEVLFFEEQKLNFIFLYFQGFQDFKNLIKHGRILTPILY